MLTLEQFNELPNNEVFARGEMENAENGIYVTHRYPRRLLKWVAKKVQ